MTEIFASTRMVGISPSGEKISITVKVGRPYVDGAGIWRCPVTVEPLYSRLSDIAGSDSFQAVLLACSLAIDLLQDFKDKGGSLTHPDGEEFRLDTYGFGGLGRAC